MQLLRKSAWSGTRHQLRGFFGDRFSDQTVWYAICTKIPPQTVPIFDLKFRAVRIWTAKYDIGNSKTKLEVVLE